MNEYIRLRDRGGDLTPNWRHPEFGRAAAEQQQPAPPEPKRGRRALAADLARTAALLRALVDELADRASADYARGRIEGYRVGWAEGVSYYESRIQPDPAIRAWDRWAPGRRGNPEAPEAAKVVTWQPPEDGSSAGYVDSPADD